MILRSFRQISRLYPVNKAVRHCSSKLEQIRNGPDLKEFLKSTENKKLLENREVDLAKNTVPYIRKEDLLGYDRKVFFEVYGCQMNVSDTEIIWSILKDYEYQKTDSAIEADVILIITCAVRESAEETIWKRLTHLTAHKKKRSKHKPLQIGILGCMAERLKTKLLEKEKLVDIIAGPDSYKDLPRLLAVGKNGKAAVNVLLSLDETYADLMPIKLDENSKSAYVSIMRGCDNMCTYCIVPFTRGRERSRPVKSIKEEVLTLYKNGIKEVTLLGQNVNSYRDISEKTAKEATILVPGFKTVYKTKLGGLRFADLLQELADSVPEMRIRFVSPHPKDFPGPVLEALKKYPNICKSLHIPAQSGSSTVLERMRRGYTREAYLDLVREVRSTLPNVTLSSDFICGFCDETEAEFSETLSLIEQVGYHIAFLFMYSMREKTTAHRRFIDNVPQEVKNRRLTEMVRVYREVATRLQAEYVGRTELVLIEGVRQLRIVIYYKQKI